MKITETLKSACESVINRLRFVIGQKRIDKINELIAQFPDALSKRLPEWSHRYFDPVKPYIENPRFVWKVSSTIIILLLTFIAYRALHDNTERQFKEVPVVEYDEIEAPEGGFNPEYVRSIKVHTEVVDDHLQIPGRLSINEDEEKSVAARVSGRIEKIFVHGGFPAKKGQPLLSIYSPDFLSAEKEYLLASSASGIISSTNDKALISDAKDLAEAAHNKLIILGMDESDIVTLRKTGTPLPLLMVRSPIDGMVLEHKSIPGQYVNMGDDVTTVADLNTVWFKGNVYEKNISSVQVGQTLIMHSDAFPGMDFKGTIDFIAPGLDPATHTLIIRATLNNPNGQLKPDVYVTGIAIIGTGNRVVIPTDAVIKEGSNSYVIQVLPGNIYRLKNVTVAPMSDAGMVSVIRGLNDEDEIVSLGAVLVYESIKRKIR